MYSLVRITSVAALAGLVLLSPDRAVFQCLAWSLALSHYVLGLVYSRGHLQALASDSSRWPWLALFAVAGGLLWTTPFPLAYYFGVHHVLNEVYMLNRVTRANRHPRVGAVRGAGLGLHAILYVVLLHRTPAFSSLLLGALLGALGLAYAVYGVLLWRARSVLSGREMLDHIALEVAALPLLGLAFVVPLTVLQVAAYHFLFWVIYPAWSFARSGSGRVFRYLLATGLVTGAFALVSPLGLVTPHVPARLFEGLFVLLSYVHITLSFALSEANPSFVRDRFRARGGMPAPA